MNQTRSRDLTMTADDVRNMQSEIFNLMAQISRLEQLSTQTAAQRLDINVDGGGFS
jgi:hypothetical protein